MEPNRLRDESRPNVSAGVRPASPTDELVGTEISAPIHRQRRGRSKRLAVIAAIFFGTFGIHRFYLGEWLYGVLYVAFCWTWIPTLLGVVDGVRYIRMSDEWWVARYGSTLATRRWQGNDLVWWTVVVVLGVLLSVSMAACVSALLTYG